MIRLPERRTNRRQLGASSVAVSPLGFGGASIGNLYAAMSDENAAAVIASAFQAGLRFFDTAPFYGFGLSEKRLGAALARCDKAAEAIVSTKVGRLLQPAANLARDRFNFIDAEPYEAVFDYSYDAVMRSYEESRKRLRRPLIDVLLAHDLGPVTHGAEHPRLFKQFMDGGYRAMRELRESGEVGAIGIGANEWEICQTALGHGDFDCFLLAGRYTLLEQTALDSFLPLCEKRRVSIIAGGPFNSGILARGANASGALWYNYAPAPPEIVARVRKLEHACADWKVPMQAAALQFPLMHPRIASVIPGLAKPEEVTQAVQWMATSIPEDFWRTLSKQGLLHPEAPIAATVKP